MSSYYVLQQFIQGNLQFRMEHAVEITSSDQHELFISETSLVFTRADNQVYIYNVLKGEESTTLLLYLTTLLFSLVFI